MTRTDIRQTAVLTPHALDRYQIHHPSADGPELLAALLRSEPISQGLVTALMGRVSPRTGAGSSSSAYFSAPDGRGIFVLGDGAVITYLRLQPSQQRFLQPSSPRKATLQPDGTHGHLEIDLLDTKRQNVRLDAKMLSDLGLTPSEFFDRLESATKLRRIEGHVYFSLDGQLFVADRTNLDLKQYEIRPTTEDAVAARPLNHKEKQKEKRIMDMRERHLAALEARYKPVLK
jgi:hypothetical protein